MTPNNNLSVLPWYSDLKYQNHRKSYAYNSIYPLFTPARTLLPFQIMRPTRANPITSVKLYDRNGIFYLDITSKIKESGLQIKAYSALGIDVIVNPGILPMAITIEEGIYYATITDGIDTWYSEMFTVVNNTSNYLKIEWSCLEDMTFDNGVIVYAAPTFKNVLYLCTEIGKPEYVFEEDGEKRDGYFFPEKQVSEKTYKFTFMAPEYLCDAMRIIRMSDIVKVTSNDLPYDCDTFLITPKWETQGDLASVEVEFQCATVVKKLGKGVILNGADFNEDFNNDFKK